VCLNVALSEPPSMYSFAFQGFCKSLSADVHKWHIPVSAVPIRTLQFHITYLIHAVPFHSFMLQEKCRHSQFFFKSQYETWYIFLLFFDVSVFAYICAWFQLYGIFSSYPALCQNAIMRWSDNTEPVTYVTRRTKHSSITFGHFIAD